MLIITFFVATGTFASVRGSKNSYAIRYNQQKMKFYWTMLAGLKSHYRLELENIMRPYKGL